MSIPIRLEVGWSKDLEDLTHPDTGSSITFKRTLYPDDPLFNTFLSCMVPEDPASLLSLWLTVAPSQPDLKDTRTTDTQLVQNGFLAIGMRKSSSSTSSNPKKARTKAPKNSSPSNRSTTSVTPLNTASESQAPLSNATLKLLSSAATSIPLTGGSQSLSSSEELSSDELRTTIPLSPTPPQEKLSSPKKVLSRTDTHSRLLSTQEDLIA